MVSKDILNATYVRTYIHTYTRTQWKVLCDSGETPYGQDRIGGVVSKDILNAPEFNPLGGCMMSGCDGSGGVFVLFSTRECKDTGIY